jgi:hypothetical protein
MYSGVDVAGESNSLAGGSHLLRSELPRERHERA